MNTPLIEARGLHSYYGSSHILRGVDFALHAGEAIGLMGRNGMGKTTLIRSLMGLVPVREGSIRFFGQEMSGTSTTGAATHRIANLGVAYVPEGRGIFPNLSVRENLLMAARPGQNGRMDWHFERVMQTFPRLGERLQHGGGQLSGGEQQMLTIGRALMTNPEILILDEATEGLAPIICEEIWRVVRTIRETGIATVIVDKNYAAVSALTDRNVVLVKGMVVFDGTAAELHADPERLKNFLGV